MKGITKSELLELVSTRKDDVILSIEMEKIFETHGKDYYFNRETNQFESSES